MSASSARLANRILIGLFVGAAAGAAVIGLGEKWPSLIKHATTLSTLVLDPLGQVFLRALFFVVIPLVFASLAAGVLQLGSLKNLGPLAARTFGLFALNMAIGVFIGLMLMNLLRPGEKLPDETRDRLKAQYGAKASAIAPTTATTLTPLTVVDMFMPKNLLGAVTGNQRNSLGEVLPLIAFALLVGAAGTRFPEEKRLRLLAGLDLVSELMTTIVNFALRLAPYAVPAMIFSVIVQTGLGILVALSLFVGGCILAMALHLFGTLSIMVAIGARRSPLQFFRDLRPVLITAFSTSSSNATLPASLTLAKDTLKISPATSGFVLPLGSTMNMSGTALYEGCVVLFIAQVFGYDLSLTQQLLLVGLSVLSAVAVAGIPGGSLPLIAGLLAHFGIPPDGIGIILGADRILDMCRTTVNVAFDLATAAIVDRAGHTPDTPSDSPA